jgi:deazaflavin-dependent oxidoreductase (nitroreductase family)
MLRDLIRSFNKHVFNRLILKVAGKTRSPFAVVRHVGRRSGQPYETPVIVEPLEDGFVFALTYGPEVDWYRNVLATGHCKLRWHGKSYAIEAPEPVDRERALAVFPLPLRLVLRTMGTRHFVGMRKS